jgi:putative membrane protein
MKEERDNTPSDGPPAEREVQLSEERTELAAQRTRDALERTLMAWIRTALSMITYGFGLFKVLQYMMKDDQASPHGASDILTMALIGLGTLLLIMAMVQYRVAMRSLQRDHDVEHRFPLTILGALGVALAGLFALTSLLFTVI